MFREDKQWNSYLIFCFLEVYMTDSILFPRWVEFWALRHPEAAPCERWHHWGATCAVCCEDEGWKTQKSLASSCTDVPEAVAGGVHQGGAGVSDRYHVSTETVGAWRRREATNYHYFQAWHYGHTFWKEMHTKTFKLKWQLLTLHLPFMGLLCCLVVYFSHCCG